MNSKNIKNKGFVLGGSFLAWTLGAAALFGGGAFLANQVSQEKDELYESDMVEEMNERMSDDFTLEYQKLSAFAIEDLSLNEEKGLLFMREEEKLARDVYRTMYEKWGIQVFQNISYSEDRHSELVKGLLDKYDISDPVIDDTTGVFTLSAMQDLYNDLVEQGNISLIEALKVGTTIEDLDIYDLNNWIEKTDNEDILVVYEKLIQGSRNHMRSFTEQLEKQGANYNAQYISQEEIDAIIEGAREKGQGADQQPEKNQRGFDQDNSGFRGQGQENRKEHGEGQGLRDGSGKGQGKGMRFNQ